MKNKYNLPEEVIDTLVDIGYTLELVEDHVTDKPDIFRLTLGTRKHLSHIRGQLNELRKLLFVEETQQKGEGI